ncbi:helix-hairpin-helix domain-containing protein [Alkalimonas delamerensis]|uniref:Helix-hairpin-helix domain-containing protein n=1 Tax=Alkalimonas delamerensis TaxID=265981 RepID=A0ABT9GMH2_9GAMM|nr:helix-hairpin-helix domain-containing protein [Alkalimonas delamerensis]MDP4528165.1 helix-hairpin-helix domain-containing protein [Alkalimonas delamerensis]
MKKMLFVFGFTFALLAANQLCALEVQPQQQLEQSQQLAGVQKIDLNRASSDELALIPGIGQQKAIAIQQHVAEHGPIRSEQELQEVRGIGPRLAATVAQYVRFED